MAEAQVVAAVVVAVVVVVAQHLAPSRLQALLPLVEAAVVVRPD